jgi:RecA-family ATPase
MRGAVVEGLATPGAPVIARRYVSNGDSPDRSGEDRGETVAPLTLLRPIDLSGKQVPERRWIVPNWIPSGVVTGLYGDGGLGKTLLAQQLLTSAALGRPWIGQYAERVKSLGLFCEDGADELHRRQVDIDHLYGCSLEHLSDITWLPRLGDDNLLAVFGSKGRAELTVFHKQTLEAARDMGARLVVIDTVSDTFGGNENDRSQVRQYVSVALGSIARAIDGAVVACAHPSRSGLASNEGDGGSTAWSNAFRSRLFLSARKPEQGEGPDMDGRVLQRKKANYAARNDEIRLRWRTGALVLDEPEGGFAAGYGRRPVEDVFLDLLASLARENQTVSENSHAPNYAPKMFALREGSEREGYHRVDFERALQPLLAKGTIRIDEFGPPSKLRRKLVRVEK